MLSTIKVDWKEWLQNVRRMSLHTVDAYERDLQHFLNFQTTHQGKTLSLEDFSTFSVRDFRAWLAYRNSEKYEHRSTARALSVIRNFFRFLEKNHQVFCPALANIHSPRLKVSLPRPLTVDQALELLENIDSFPKDSWIGSRDKALFTLLYACGLRLGEALGLKRKDAPSQGETLRVQGKGKKERLVPVLPIVHTTLEEYIRLCPYPLPSEGPLFIGAQGKALAPAIAQKALRLYRRTMGLPETATPHALRHSYATHLMNTSGDLRAIQELLGHASLTTTQVYTNVETTRLMKIYEKAHPRAKTS